MHLTLFIGIAIIECRYVTESLSVGLGASLRSILGYLFALFASIAARRLFFHRLQSFPGPILAKVSKLWHLYHCLDSRNHLVLDDLHNRYGDFVRTGQWESIMALYLALNKL